MFAVRWVLRGTVRMSEQWTTMMLLLIMGFSHYYSYLGVEVKNPGLGSLVFLFTFTFTLLQRVQDCKFAINTNETNFHSVYQSKMLCTRVKTNFKVTVYECSTQKSREFNFPHAYIEEHSRAISSTDHCTICLRTCHYVEHSLFFHTPSIFMGVRHSSKSPSP